MRDALRLAALTRERILPSLLRTGFPGALESTERAEDFMSDSQVNTSTGARIRQGVRCGEP